MPAASRCSSGSGSEHDSFFERYPLTDGITVVLNSALLFFVLLYVYSLKFMFDAFMFQVFGLQGRAHPVKGMSLPELANASTLYGLGFCVLMLLFTLLYLHAYRRRDALELTPQGAFDARAVAGHHALSALVGLSRLRPSPGSARCASSSSHRWASR